MECDDVRVALSARLDGEDPGIPDAPVDRHLESCRSCAAWGDELATLHRMVRVREAEPVPDLSAAIVDAFSPAAGRSRRPAGATTRRPVLGEPISGARWALFVVALTQLVLAAPALFGDDPGATVHVARELGSFDVALAIGLLVAAWQPARAWGLLPLAASLACVMAGTSLLDIVNGRTHSAAEAPHLLDLAGVVLLWWVAREARSTVDRRRSPTLA
jgi:predicted anti-sigma-YlaC factor YlaD